MTVKKFRIALSRLRTSSRRLEIEAGRWSIPVRKPIAERLCFLCNTLEDEFHFIFKCPVYSDFRSQYIKKNLWKRPNMLEFIKLMTSENRAVLQKVACYVHKSFELKNEMLYKR